MIKPLPTLLLKPLVSVSPSQFSRLESCALQVVIQKSLPENLLPPGPMTFLGNATHKLFELVTKGKLTDEPALKQHFDQLIAYAEAALLDKGLGHLVPLAEQITDFALRRRQVIRRALSLVPAHAQSTGISSGTYQVEERFESANKQVVGYIDAIRQTSNGAEIIDYKSGQVLDETGLQVKAAYRQQLLLYAYLYWERHGIWPVRLLLVGLTGLPHDVPYTPDDARSTYQQAVRQLAQANAHIETNDWAALAATATPTECPACSVRAVCPKCVISPATQGLADVTGVLSSVRETPRGLRLEVIHNGQTFVIMNVPIMHLLTLTGLIDRLVQLLHIRAVGTLRYEWLGRTVLFWT